MLVVVGDIDVGDIELDGPISGPAQLGLFRWDGTDFTIAPEDQDHHLVETLRAVQDVGLPAIVLWPNADAETGRHYLSDSVYRINAAMAVRTEEDT